MGLLPHPNAIVSTIVLFLIVFASCHIRGVHQNAIFRHDRERNVSTAQCDRLSKGSRWQKVSMAFFPFQIFIILLGVDRETEFRFHVARV